MKIFLYVLGHINALPTTLLAFILAVVGGATPVRLQGPEGAWIWHVEKGLLAWFFKSWKFHIGAQTIGSIILVLPDCDPRLLSHERCHVRQGFVLGALYLPVYFISSFVAWAQDKDAYNDNWMEVQARAAAVRELI